MKEEHRIRLCVSNYRANKGLKVMCKVYENNEIIVIRSADGKVELVQDKKTLEVKVGKPIYRGEK